MYHYNPDTPLRSAYIAALQAFISGVPVYPDKVPKSADIPTQYILITTQTTTRTAVAKPTDLSEQSDNFGWLCNIVFDIQVIGPSGFSNPGAVDYIFEQLINVAENITVNDWAVKSRVFVQSRLLNIDTPDNYINRKVVTYQHWIDKL